MKTIGTILREIRKEKGYSVGQVRIKTGLQESTIYHYESGKRQPNLNTLIKVAKAYGMRTSDILLRMENENEI